MSKYFSALFILLIAVSNPVPGSSAVVGPVPVMRIRGHFPLRPFQQPRPIGRSAYGTSLEKLLDPPWTFVSDMPVPTAYNAGVSVNGLVYSFGGYDWSNPLPDAYVYNPATNSWSPIGTMSSPRANPAVTAIGSLIYIANGYGPADGTIDIYDTVSGTWSTGAANPAVLADGSVAVTLQDKMYVIAGCNTGPSCATSVEVYDPATDSWFSAADYPEEVGYLSCGTINDKIYCAGGQTDTYNEVIHAYAYDPGADNWSGIADMPQGAVASAFAVSGDKLYISGGLTVNLTVVTNEGFAYDPVADSWSPIENSITARWTGGSACGLFKFGGFDASPNLTATTEMYPGLICPGACPAIALDPAALPDGVTGTPYSQALTASGGTGPYALAVTGGTLPDGLSMDATGQISGTPTVVGTFTFDVTATDSNSCAGAKSYTVNVVSGCLWCDDFEDSSLSADWTVIKPSWMEAGGLLSGGSERKKATIVAGGFAGCRACYEEARITTTGGQYSKTWMLGWYIDRRNTVELLIKEDNDKMVLRQRVNGVIVSKAKAPVTIVSGVAVVARVAFDGINFTVTVDGNELLTLPASGTVPAATVGFAVKDTTTTFDYLTVNN